MASTPGWRSSSAHYKECSTPHLTVAIVAAVTFALMFLFDWPWLGAAVVVLSGIAWILLKLNRGESRPQSDP